MRSSIIGIATIWSSTQGSSPELSIVVFFGIFSVDLLLAAVSHMKRHDLDEDGVERCWQKNARIQQLHSE